MGAYPALSIQPPENPINNVAKLVALKTALANQQYQQQVQPLELQAQQVALQEHQQALKDQQAGIQAYQQWDGKDYNDLADLAGKAGGSLNFVTGIRQKGIELRKNLSDALKNEGEAGRAKVQTMMDNNTIAAGKLSAISGLPDEQLSQGLLNTAQEGVQAGWIDPQHLQEAQKLAQQPPDQIRQQLPLVVKSYQTLAQQQDQALKDYQTQTEAAELPGKKAQAAQQVAVQQEQAASGLTPSQFAVKQASKMASAEAYGRLGAEKQLEQFKIDQQRKLYPDALQTVAPNLVAPAAAQYEKATTEFAGANAAAQEMKDIIDLARGGNKIAYAYSPTTGVLTINSANGVKRVNMAEIQSYSGAGSLVDRIQGWLGKQVNGQSLPKDILDDMDALHSRLTDTANTKYNSEVQGTNAAYGSQFKPQNFSKANSKGSLTADQIQQAAKDHGVSVDEAKRQAIAQGYTVQ